MDGRRYSIIDWHFFVLSKNYKGTSDMRGGFKESDNSSPLVSVITVVFNGEKYLEETIQSVINQTYDNFEYILIDGGSTDGTVDIIRKYEEKIMYWVSERDRGIYDAWNKGLLVAKGDWIMFLGADDTLEPKAVEKYVNFIIDIPQDLEYISSKVNLIDKSKHYLKTIGKPWKWETFRRYMNVAHVASLHNKSLFEKYGNFDTSYKIAGDYEFLLRAGNGLKAAFLDDIVANMGADGVSNAYISLALSEAVEAQMQNKALPLILIKIYQVLTKIKFEVKTFFKVV